MSDKILIEYGVSYAQLKADSKAIQEELRTNESVGVKAADNTTKAIVKTEKATISLKKQYTTLKAELATATDPKKVEELAKKVGKLKDQLEDAGDAAKVFASESKFEQMGSALGSVGSKLANLDFKGAADQSKLLISVVKSFSVKDVIDGVKDLGTAFLNVGKALLGNPVFLLAAALAAIGVAAYTIGKAFADVNVQTLTVTESLTAGKKAIQEYADRFAEAQIKIRESLGQISKSQADSARASIESNKEIRAKNAEHAEAVIKLAKELDIDLRNIDEQGNAKKLALGGYFDNVQRLNIEKFNREKAKIDVDFNKQMIDLVKTQAVNRSAIEIDANVKAGAAAKAVNDKLRADKLASDKKLNDELIAEAQRLAKVLRDLQTGNIKLDYERRKQQILDNFSDEAAKYKGHNDILQELEIKKNNELNDLAAEREAKYQKILQEGRDKSIEIFKQAAKDMVAEDTQLSKKFISNQEKITAEEKKQIELRRRFQSEYGAFLMNAAQTAQQINSNAAEKQLMQVEENASAETAAVQEQYESGAISKEQYEQRKLAIDKRTKAEEARIKKKEFETNKQFALIQVAISTAMAIAKTAGELGYPAAIPFIILAAANAALQIAAIESQPTPKFEKGGKVGGKRHSQGGTLIEAEKDEYVIRRTESIKHDRLLTAINKGQAGKFISEFYIAPALKAQRKKFESGKQDSFADSLVKSLSINSGNFNDSNITEALKMNRKNDREIALFLAKEMKAGRNNSSRQW